jgi:hypothetical protein
VKVIITPVGVHETYYQYRPTHVFQLNLKRNFAPMGQSYHGEIFSIKNGSLEVFKETKEVKHEQCIRSLSPRCGRCNQKDCP